jgi:hypothetical protein
LFASLLPLHGANAACADKETAVRYEPEIVKLSGTIAIGQSKHPNGTMMTYPILRLTAPIVVEPSSRADPVNSRETCVREVQLVASDDTIRKRLHRLGAQSAKVTGTLFHGHTAWHVREIVMQVVSAEPAR